MAGVLGSLNVAKEREKESQGRHKERGEGEYNNSSSSSYSQQWRRHSSSSSSSSRRRSRITSGRRDADHKVARIIQKYIFDLGKVDSAASHRCQARQRGGLGQVWTGDNWPELKIASQSRASEDGPVGRGGRAQA